MQGYPPAQQASRTSGAALASLICGIVGCFPFLTSLAAVVLGVVGLRATRDPATRGRGLAIAGLVLGLIGVFFWSLFGVGMIAAYVSSGPARALAKQFIADLNGGHLNAAANKSTLSAAELTPALAQLKGQGPLQDTTVTSFHIESAKGKGTTCELTLTAQFANGQSTTYQMTLVKTPQGWKVASMRW
jgi:hypothetical protein